MKATWHFLAIPLLLLASSAAAGATGNNWIDAISLTFGNDEDSIDADIYRLGLENRWERTWFNGGAWHVGGYWDAELAYLEADAGHGENNEPVRYQPDTGIPAAARYRTFQRGIPLCGGRHWRPPALRHESCRRALLTVFQFGSLLGLGLGFGKHGQYEFGYRYQHISNASMSTPNDGLNLHMLRLGYSFY